MNSYLPTVLQHYFADNAYHQWQAGDVRTHVNAMTSQTFVKLYVGGKSTVQYLLQIACAAKAYGFDWFSGGWPGTPEYPATPTVLGQQPDANGFVWGQAKGNADMNVTMTTPSAHYAGGPTQSSDVVRGTLRIRRGNQDVTEKKTKVIVGETIDLTCEWVEGGAEITNYLWSVPGMTFSNYEANANSGILYTDFCKTNSGVTYYWIDGGDGREVQCACIVKGQPLSAKTTFDVVRPDVSWELSPRGGVAVDQNYVGDDPQFTGMYYLHDGSEVSTNDVGMNYSYKVNTLKGWAGSFFRLYGCQIISLDWKKNMDFNKSKTLSGRALDRIVEMPWVADTSFDGFTQDSPADRLDYNVSYSWRSDSFETYLMFQPSKGKPVPLNLATWSWSGQAKRIINSDYSFESFVPVQPLVAPSGSTGGDCYSHPTWQTNSDDLQRYSWQTNSTPYPTP